MYIWKRNRLKLHIPITVSEAYSDSGTVESGNLRLRRFFCSPFPSKSNKQNLIAKKSKRIYIQWKDILTNIGVHLWWKIRPGHLRKNVDKRRIWLPGPRLRWG